VYHTRHVAVDLRGVDFVRQPVVYEAVMMQRERRASNSNSTSLRSMARLSNPLVKLARESLDDRCAEEVPGAELLFAHVERLDCRRDVRVLKHHKLVIVRMRRNVA
jgi:hypothetical protein